MLARVRVRVRESRCVCVRVRVRVRVRMSVRVRVRVSVCVCVRVRVRVHVRVRALPQPLLFSQPLLLSLYIFSYPLPTPHFSNAQNPASTPTHPRPGPQALLMASRWVGVQRRSGASQTESVKLGFADGRLHGRAARAGARTQGRRALARILTHASGERTAWAHAQACARKREPRRWGTCLREVTGMSRHMLLWSAWMPVRAEKRDSHSSRESASRNMLSGSRRAEKIP